MSLAIIAAALLAGAAGIFIPTGIYSLATAMRPEQAYMPAWKRELTNENQEATQQAKVLSQVEIDRRRTFLLIILGGIAAGGIAWTVTGMTTVALAASLAGLAMPNLWTTWQIRAREKQLSRQLEEACERMSAYIRSGGSLLGALEAAAQTAGEPVASVLTYSVAKMRLGVSASDVLMELAERTGVPEMRMLAVASSLQQKGMAVNMGAVYAQVQDNIRERRELTETLSSLTAENRLAGGVVAVVPFATLGIMRQLAPEFINPLFTTSLGITVFAICSAVIIAGIAWVFKMGAVEI